MHYGSFLLFTEVRDDGFEDFAKKNVWDMPDDNEKLPGFIRSCLGCATRILQRMLVYSKLEE